tara:strand:- start:82 stop:1665 length:1584 start_codon:yes stop_codon:yes gene_type:complete
MMVIYFKLVEAIMDRFMRKCAVDRKIVQQLLLKKSFNQITKDLKVGKRRIRSVHDEAERLGYLSGTKMPDFPQPIFEYKNVQAGSKSPYDDLLMSHKDWILERMEANWKLITIYEELPIDWTNISMSYSTMLRFLARHKFYDLSGRTERKRVVPEIISEPGEVLQLDWGKLRDVIDPKTGKKRTLWAFVGIMGFSRYMMVKLVWDNKTETTLNAIEEMFNELGGVPKKIVSDNPKCFTTTASKYEPVLNPAFERFCSHYNVIPEILGPREPEKKGKVERAMPYVRRLYEAHGLGWDGIEESQDYLNKKVVIANERKHGTTKLRPIDVLLQQEVSKLSNLPGTSYDIEEYHIGKVRKDGYVRFRTKDYSLDEKYHGEEVFVIGNSKRVEIYHKGILLETHSRVTSPYQQKSTKNHHLKPWEQVAQDSKMYIEKAEKIGPAVKQFISEVLMFGRGYVDTRKVWGVLSLDKDYPKEDIDKACKYALEIESLSYQTVRSYLKLRPQSHLNLEKSNNNKFVRSTDEYKKHLQ